MADTPDSGSGTASNPFYHSPRSVCGPTSAGAKKVNLRAEIDTSPPFGSVKEAVTHFESSGAWIHLHKLGLGDSYLHDNGDIDIKKVEEQTLELEKDLIVKELETLDVLEELGTTKRMVEDLKWQLQKEALKCMNEQMPTPDVGKVNKENHIYLLNCARDKLAVGNSSPCPISSPDQILMELNQAKLNLGKTVNELGSIQTSVGSLSMKIKKKKALLEKARQKMTTKKAQQGNQPQYADAEDMSILDNSPHGQANKNLMIMKTAEMKLVAAKKMEEAARAAEAVALAEIKALSGSHESPLSFLVPEHDAASAYPKSKSPLRSRAQKMQKRSAREAALLQTDHGGGVSKLSILKKIEDATEEVKLSKRALEEALKRVEIANRKQLDAGEALLNWAPESRPRRGNPASQPDYLPVTNLPKPNNVEDDSEPKPVSRSNLSMRDVLSRKQVVLPEDYVPRRQTESRKVALSQMLNELREDITFPSGSEGNQQKQFVAQRKKFGFIHISLPLTKPGRKNTPNSDVR